jgi:hypothetical protein
MNRGIRRGAWSRYIFPFNIDNFVHLKSTLYMRHADQVSYVVHDSLYDDGSPFDGTIQWQWLDFGEPGVDKTMFGFDIAAIGTSSIEVGYDQSALGSFTTPYAIPADNYPDQLIPFYVKAPSLSVRLTFDGGQAWQWSALNLHLMDGSKGT